MAISEVQANGSAGLSGSTITITLSSGVTAGNTVVVVCSYLDGGTIGLDSVTDNQSNSYIISIAQFSSGGNRCTLLMASAVMGSSSSLTITVTLSSLASVADITAVEYHSTLGSLTSYNSAFNNGSGSSPVTMANTSNPTLFNNAGLIVAAMAYRTANGGSLPPASPWVQRYLIDNNISSLIALSVGDVVAATNSTATIAWTSNSLTTIFWATLSLSFYEPPLPVEDEQPWIAQVQSRLWLSKPFDYDESGSSLLNSGSLENEPSWIAQTESVLWQAVPFSDDEISASLIDFPVEDTEAWVAQIESIPWQAKPFLDDEICLFIMTVTNAQRGRYRIQNQIEGWNLWVGSGALPNLTGSPTQFSATLPFNYVLTLPGSGNLTYYLLVTKQDLYGLNSQNQYYTTITIDSSGNLVLPPVTPPQGLQLYPRPNGTIRVLAAYPGYGLDAYPATAWRVWIGSSPPNPLSDPPTLTQNITGKALLADIAGYTPGTYYAAVALYRQTDNTQSTALTGTVILPNNPNELTAVPSGFQILP